MDKKTTVLMILDGFGINERTEGNAIRQAKTPVLDSLKAKYPCVKGYASGRAVGLPDGQMGNSEVGHLNIGAGRIVYQELTRITKSIEDGDFFENPALMDAVEHCKKNNSALHLYGLLSDGGVHSHNTHLYALLQLAKRNGLEKVFVHVFLDGRDTPPASGADYTAQLEEKIREIGVGKIATVMGRFYVMDRDKRWERIEKAYNCLVLGEGNKADSSKEAILNSYKNGKTDEFVEPVNIGGKRISDNDAVIFFNYRPDRAREITRAIAFKDFDGFNRKKVLNNLYYVCMTQYDETFGLPVAFKPQKLVNILGEVLDANNIKQFRTAETEKYAHITFFFNGGVEEPNKLETRKLVASPKVATYDLKPEMSAYEVCDNVLEALDNKDYGFILVNFANPDMVGHTGVMEAAVKACSAVDECVGKIAEKALKNGVKMIITADHGNAEWMFNEQTNAPQTAHTTNIVPFIIVDSEKYNLKETGALCDIAPTILDLMGIKQPSEMTGHSMIKH